MLYCYFCSFVNFSSVSILPIIVSFDIVQYMISVISFSVVQQVIVFSNVMTI